MYLNSCKSIDKARWNGVGKQLVCPMKGRQANQSTQVWLAINRALLCPDNKARNGNSDTSILACIVVLDGDPQ